MRYNGHWLRLKVFMLAYRLAPCPFTLRLKDAQMSHCIRHMWV